METLLSVPDLAGRLGKSVWAVRRRIREGAICAVNIGSDLKPEYRVRESELQRYLTERTAA